MLDWCKAEAHLTACEEVYSVVEPAGYFVLVCVISPLRSRLNKGERTNELWNEIMETQI